MAKSIKATGSRRQVMTGTAKHTSGGLTKADLRMHNGRIVSKARQEMYKANPALEKVRKEFHSLVKKHYKAAPKLGWAAAMKAASKEWHTKKAAPKKVESKKAAPKKVESKKATPKKVASKKAAPKKVASKKAAPRKVASKKAAPKKVASKKAAPKKVASKKASGGSRWQH